MASSSLFSMPPYKPMNPGVCSPGGLGSLILRNVLRRLVMGVLAGGGDPRRVGAVYEPPRRLRCRASGKFCGVCGCDEAASASLYICSNESRKGDVNEGPSGSLPWEHSSVPHLGHECLKPCLWSTRGAQDLSLLWSVLAASQSASSSYGSKGIREEILGWRQAGTTWIGPTPDAPLVMRVQWRAHPDVPRRAHCEIHAQGSPKWKMNPAPHQRKSIEIDGLWESRPSAAGV